MKKDNLRNISIIFWLVLKDQFFSLLVPEGTIFSICFFCSVRVSIASFRLLVSEVWTSVKCMGDWEYMCLLLGYRHTCSSAIVSIFSIFVVLCVLYFFRFYNKWFIIILDRYYISFSGSIASAAIFFLIFRSIPVTLFAFCFLCLQLCLFIDVVSLLVSEI